MNSIKAKIKYEIFCNVTNEKKIIHLLYFLFWWTSILMTKNKMTNLSEHWKRCLQAN